jgi:signal transduction histidine kinase
MTVKNLLAKRSYEDWPQVFKSRNAIESSLEFRRPKGVTPKLERALLSQLRPILDWRRLAILERAVCREQRLLARSLQNIQGNSPIPESLRAVSRMVALICHDLGLPLTAILANAEFLTQSNISEMERAGFYQEIRWSIDQMNELVSSLLECSKDRDAFRPAALHVVDTVEQASSQRPGPWAGSIPTVSNGWSPTSS